MSSRVASALELLELYDRSAPLFLASPRYTMLALGVRDQVKVEGGPGQWKSLGGRVRSLFEARPSGELGVRDVIVGVLPFDEALPARLILAGRVRWAKPMNGELGVCALSAAVGVFDARHIPEMDCYMAGVRNVIGRIGRGEVSKVVLARSIEMTAAANLDVHALLRKLVWSNKGAYRFAVDVSGRLDQGAGGQRTLIGASPELLVSRHGLDVVANPLAGSVPRCADRLQDQRAGSLLLHSRKDRREHAFVTEAVVESLRPLCRHLRVAPQPSLLQTNTMWHLSTKVRARLRDPSTCALTLAITLHPTPAVCGTPTPAALSAILELEGFERGFYAGLVGWSDVTGDGEWIVTLRCAEVVGKVIRMFAGAGIVEGSDAQGELNETSAKLRTVLSALGLAS